MANLALSNLKKKIPDLILALDGRTDEHFRWTLKRLLKKLFSVDGELAEIDARLCAKYQANEDVLNRLCTIPGVNMTTARVLPAELGTDVEEFPTAAHAASWVGLVSRKFGKCGETPKTATWRQVSGAPRNDMG